MAENFLKLGKEMDIQIHEAENSLNMVNPEGKRPWNIVNVA